MDLGTRLANARAKQNLTRQEAAERLGVDPQRIADWEENTVTHDDSTAVRLGELYQVDLTDLMAKEDAPVTPEEQAPKASRRRSSVLLVLLVYLAVWAVMVALFWVRLKPGDDALGYGLLTFYFILPAVTLVASAFIGRDTALGPKRWLMILFFGGMYMLAQYVTFSLATMRATGSVRTLPLNMLAAGLLLSAVGMAIGAVLHRLEFLDKIRTLADQTPPPSE